MLTSEKVLRRLELWVYGAAWVSVAVVIGFLLLRVSFDVAWIGQVAVFALVAVGPQWFIDRIASVAETLSPDLPTDLGKRGFHNLGAFVGLVERPLFLGSLVGGYPEFIAVWFVFKGIAGYRLGLSTEQRKERRLFQLFLLNNALSLSGAALGWVLWQLLFPTYTK